MTTWLVQTWAQKHIVWQRRWRSGPCFYNFHCTSHSRGSSGMQLLIHNHHYVQNFCMALPSRCLGQKWLYSQGLLQSLERMSACTTALDPELAAADASLAELAVSLPLAMDLHRGLVQCRITRLTFPASRRSGAVLGFALENSSVHPVTDAWTLLAICEDIGSAMHGGSGAPPHHANEVCRASSPQGSGEQVVNCVQTIDGQLSFPRQAGYRQQCLASRTVEEDRQQVQGKAAMQFAVPFNGLLPGGCCEHTLDLPTWTGGTNIRMFLCHSMQVRCRVFPGKLFSRQVVFLDVCTTAAMPCS